MYRASFLFCTMTNNHEGVW